MKPKATIVTQARVQGQGVRNANDLGARVRKLHKSYKQAMVMTMAGATDTEIVEALNVEGIDENTLKERMEDLLKHLQIDSFEAPALQSRPVRRALKGFQAP